MSDLGYANPTERSGDFPPGSPIIAMWGAKGHECVSVKIAPLHIKAFWLDEIERTDVPRRW